MKTRRVSAATTFLIRAFAPGCPTMLRSWASVPVQAASGQHKRGKREGEQLTLFYDLPDGPAEARAFELAKSAAALRLVRVGRTVIRDLTAEVCTEHRTLKVEALLVDDSQRWGEAHG